MPTTHFKRREVFPRNTLPADYFTVQTEHAHFPLIVMLVLTQLSVGAFLVEQLSQWFGQGRDIAEFRPVQCALGLCCGLLALAASTLHLGRPHLAYRAMLGLRYSWLSREILAFGGFALLAGLYSGAAWFATAAAPPVGWTSSPSFSVGSLTGWGAAVVLSGLAGIVCSIKIYQCTRRPFWNGPSTSLKFFLTTGWLGCATTLCAVLLSVAATSRSLSPEVVRYASALCRVMLVLATVKLLVELAVLTHLTDRTYTPLRRSALLLTGKLSRVFAARLVCGGFGGLLMPWCLLLELQRSANVELSAAIGWITTCLLIASVAGELLERSLFFTAAVAPRMPGALRT